MPSAVTALLLPMLCGYFFVSAICPSRRFHVGEQAFTASLGGGIGVGLSSVLMFLCLLVFKQTSTIGVVVTELLVLVITFASFVVSRRRTTFAFTDRLRWNYSAGKFACLFLVALATATGGTVAVLRLVREALALPHGSWDAWAIWNMHARCLFRSGSHWMNVFLPNPFISHPYYPMLLPASITACWTVLGHDSIWVPILIGLFFPLATVLLLAGALSMVRTTGQGLLAALMLLATPAFITQGSWQMADIPLAFFNLSTLVCLCLSSRIRPLSPRLALIAGLSAGMSAWTKNEGMLFAVATSLVWFGHMLFDKSWRKQLSILAGYIAGLAPMLMLVAYYKLCWAPPDYLFANQDLVTVLSRGLDLQRYQSVLGEFATQAISFGQWKVNPIPVFLLYAVVAGSRMHRRDLLAAWKSAVVVALVLFGEFLIFQTIVPVDLHLYLIWGVHRMFMQLWPSVVFTYFFAVSPPEQIFRDEPRLTATKVAPQLGRISAI